LADATTDEISALDEVARSMMGERPDQPKRRGRR
jgi:hypothetical protein